MTSTSNESVIAIWLVASSSVSREELLHIAKLAEQAERYDDMMSAMKAVAEKGHELSTEERNLLSVAYKNTIGPRRSAWRLISSMEVKLVDLNDKKQTIIKEYRQRIENEMQKICGEIQNLLDDHLLKNSRSDESSVFYNKMKGDYYRYLAEAAIGNERHSIIENSEHAYKNAMKMADERMAPTHPVRLGLALNYSVFLYEIKNDALNATKLAKMAYDAAIADVEKLQTDEAYKDTTLILQLLRDNVTLWTTEHFMMDEADS